jgi:hypothetical protein
VIEAKNINGYLIDAPDVFVESRNKALCDIPLMTKGSQPTDDGNLIIEADEYEDFITKEPNANKFIRPFIGAQEFLNKKKPSEFSEGLFCSQVTTTYLENLFFKIFIRYFTSNVAKKLETPPTVPNTKVLTDR